MQLRLAFAVAAFLENEILIIDEVLAVGDSEFQKKCIGKMGDISKSGRTILFVSHQFSAIKNLCKKGIFLKNGMVHSFGETDEVIAHYSDFIENEYKIKAGVIEQMSNDSEFIFKINSKRENVIFNMNENITFYLESKRPNTEHILSLGISIKDKFEKRVLIDFYEFNNTDDKLKLNFSIPANFLTPGKYFVDLSLQTSYEQFWLKNNVSFFEINIISTIYESFTYDYGLVCSNILWEEK